MKVIDIIRKCTPLTRVSIMFNESELQFVSEEHSVEYWLHEYVVCRELLDKELKYMKVCDNVLYLCCGKLTGVDNV